MEPRPCLSVSDTEQNTPLLFPSLARATRFSVASRISSGSCPGRGRAGADQDVMTTAPSALQLCAEVRPRSVSGPTLSSSPAQTWERGVGGKTRSFCPPGTQLRFAISCSSMKNWGKELGRGHLQKPSEPRSGSPSLSFPHRATSDPSGVEL